MMRWAGRVERVRESCIQGFLSGILRKTDRF